MRKLFPGYYKPTEDEFKKIWNDGIIIFDTNVLLDFYRYSEETSNILFDIVESVKDRIWIPFKVSFEYHKNLSTVISGQIKKYNDSIKTLQDFKKQINEKRNHPFLSEELHKEINDFCDKFDKELELKKEKVKTLITANPFKDKLAEILEEKIGNPLSTQELEKIYEEGIERFNSNIPPGYKDKSKPGNEKYNDLVIWTEILNRNSQIDSPILLVTGDKKEDWFQKELGLTIGPRPELIDEFKKKKDNLFYCYATDSFLKYAKEYLGIQIEDKVVKEVGELLAKSRINNDNEATEVENGNTENDSTSLDTNSENNIEQSSETSESSNESTTE